jgi:hypothetical protein
MPKFDIPVDGIIIPVEAPDKESAARAVAEAIQANPQFIEKERSKVAVELSENLTPLPGSVNRFLLGAAHTMDQTLGAVGITDSEGRDPAYEALDNATIAFGAEDFGELSVWAPAAVFGAGALGAAVARKIGTKLLGLAGRRLAAWVRLARKVDGSVKEVMEKASTPQGQQIAKGLAQAAETAPEAAEAAMAASLRSATTRKIRDAQLRIGRELRAQEQAAGRAAQAEQAAARQAQAQAQQRVAQNEFARIERSAVKKTEQQQLRESIRRIQSGQVQ